ncbi:MAG TPA: extracellular solute-binding protein [Streptosporangiaceae bacterium]
MTAPRTARTRSRRRAWPLALALALVALVASGCATSSAGSSTNVQLYSDKAAWKPFYQQMSSLAHKQIGTTITPNGYADEPTYQAFIKSSLQTPDQPDLFTWATGPLLQQLAAKGQLSNTSALWQQAIANGDLPKSLEQYYTVNGQQYCIPENVSYWVMFYNKHIFQRDGLTVPTTWQQLMADSATLKQHGTVPFYETNVLFSFVWFQTLLAGSDPGLYARLTEGKASYTDPGVVKVMQQWRDMIDHGYMSDPGIKTDPATMLKTGQVAMVPNGTWFDTSMVQAGMKPGTDYGMFVIPAVNPALTSTPVALETGPLCIPSKPANKQQDMKFASWWLKPAAQAKWSDSRDDVSANPKVKINDQELNTLTHEVAGSKYQLVNRYFDAVSPTVLTAALDAFSAFMANPNSYQSQLATIQQAASGGAGS